MIVQKFLDVLPEEPFVCGQEIENVRKRILRLRTGVSASPTRFERGNPTNLVDPVCTSFAIELPAEPEQERVDERLEGQERLDVGGRTVLWREEWKRVIGASEKEKERWVSKGIESLEGGRRTSSRG